MSRIRARSKSALALVVGVALTLCALLVGPQLVLAEPARPDFTVTPQAPLPGQTVTFTATGLKPNSTVAWDFENDGRFDATGSTVQHAYATGGQRTVLMRVTKDGEVTDVLKTVTVNTAPTASFTASPNPALVGATVQFNATGSSDPDGTIANYAWDLDNDGQFDDASGAAATRSFAAPGTYTVGLRVTDNRGSTGTTTSTVTVTSVDAPPPPPPPNQLPVASVTASPNPATVGQTVQLNAGGSSDPDGTIASYAWDLDNDGQFDDASGATASRAFPSAGTYTVRLAVTDNRGATDTAAVAVSVNEAPSAPPPNQTRPPIVTVPVFPPAVLVTQQSRMMSPFPVVRLVARLSRRGANVRLLLVRGAPRGAVVTVRCRGRRCGRLRDRTAAVSSSGRVRVRSFERRLLRAGVSLQVLVTQSGKVGKYTSFKIRRSRAPIRRDLCVLAVGTRPAACPSS